jgi:S1-C subfamily serine protease
VTNDVRLIVDKTKKRSRHLAIAALGLFALFALFAAPIRAASLNAVIHDVQQRSVKIYGAGGLRGLDSYQSGFLISADGYVVTVFSHVLDSDVITVTLDDGRRFEAKLTGADPRLDVAVLKIEASDLPCFDFQKAATAAEGTRVLAFSNLFGVATGDESVSVLHGTVAAVAPLSARRGAFETPYQGPVYVLDAMTNNPGAQGGVLTSVRGELLGMLGKELRNSQNNTWLNYALPASELVEAVEAIKAGKAPAGAGQANKRAPAKPLKASDLGLVIVPNVLERTPPFVDEVRKDSPAAATGVRADDLVVFVNGQLVQSCRALEAELGKLDHDAQVKLTILRDNQLMEMTLQAMEH